MYGQEHLDQIKGHWEAFGVEDKQIFLWINKEPISKAYSLQIIDALNEYNDRRGTKIGFASTTFKEICRCFSEILQEYDLEMNALIEDYADFCSEARLIDNVDEKVRVVLTGQTLEQNLQYNFYYHPRDRGYQNTRYIGLYKGKAVRAIGELCCIADVDYNPDTGELRVVDTLLGTLTREQKEVIRIATVEAKENYGYSIGEGSRFFFVSKYYETEHIKSSRGGLMGTRYIDLGTVEGFKKDMKLSEIAALLREKKWDIG